jgi:hypothetical protein
MFNWNFLSPGIDIVYVGNGLYEVRYLVYKVRMFPECSINVQSMFPECSTGTSSPL